MEEEKASKNSNLRIIKTNLYFILFFILVWGAWHLVKTKLIYPNDKRVDIEVPSVYQNLSIIDSNTLIFTHPETLEETRFKSRKAQFSLADFENVINPHDSGLLFVFKKRFEGKIIYGFYPDEVMKFPHPVYSKHAKEIINGEVLIPIKEQLSGKYDLANWEKKGKGRIGYRILNQENNIIYTGSINFTGKGPFQPEATILQGPFISNVDTNSATIWFTTNFECDATLSFPGILKDQLSTGKRHAFKVTELRPDSTLDYSISINQFQYKGQVTAAPNANSQRAFTFAFASDSRGSLNVGESNIYGHNGYIMKKIGALINHKETDFFQFTGDLIDGYEDECGSMNLQYANWFTTVSPFMSSTPIHIGFGNHESFLMTDFPRSVDAFPFETRSGEKQFADWIENPQNGPESEDGSSLDPNKDATDFPSYKENVYSYRYGNTAMIVLNSNYLYTPVPDIAMQVGGNIHGYIMDNQLAWLENQISTFEKDSTIDHVFVTIHTPAFPIGGHAKNDMWYYGDNTYRPFIAGQLAEKGIIERRDEFLNIIVNKSSKMRALLTGDEHNYSRLVVSDSTARYPEDWSGEKLTLNKPFVQIVNGSAGAPYYGREDLPWYDDVQKFSPQFAVVFFHINGLEIELEVVNPDTYELIEKLKLY